MLAKILTLQGLWREAGTKYPRKYPHDFAAGALPATLTPISRLVHARP